jgi:hypothetical protein
MTYTSIALEVAATIEKKQVAYGDAFGKSGKVMRILYPDGIPPEKMDDALTVVRMLDKLFRIATDRDALGESPWRDIAGYALLSIARVETKPLDLSRCQRCGEQMTHGHICPPFEPQT